MNAECMTNSCCYSCLNWHNCRDENEHMKEDIDSVYLDEIRREDGE